MKPSLERLLDLQRLLTAFSQVDRKVFRKHAGEFIYENDTEHSYNLAVTAWFLCQHFTELDSTKVIAYSLVHDLVEVHAGDTFSYGTPEEIASKSDREAVALQKLEKDWHDFPELLSTIHDYEKKQTPEAKFVYALDKIMPIMQIYVNEGHSWKQQHVTLEMLKKEKTAKVAVSPEIEPYFYELYDLLLTHPELIKKS